MRRGFAIPVLVSMLLSLSVFGSVVAQEASPASGSGSLGEMGFPELAISTDGTTADIPSELEAGRYLLSVTNTSSDLNVDIELYQIPEGVTQDDLLAAMESGEIPEWFHDTTFGGGVSVMPGATTSAVLDITPGEWIINVYGFDNDHTVDNNTPTTVTVTGDMPMVEDPESAVTASMIDYDFEITQPVPSGLSVWHLQNAGTEPHHLVVFGVPDGATQDQVLEAFMMFFGPPASPEAVASPVALASPAAAGLTPDDVVDVFGTAIFSTDRSMWAEYDLAPGTYAAVCFLPTPDGVPHVMMGMIEIFTVEE
jgi:hypothetical protein